jgi:hypothetical protein
VYVPFDFHSYVFTDMKMLLCTAMLFYIGHASFGRSAHPAIKCSTCRLMKLLAYFTFIIICSFQYLRSIVFGIQCLMLLSNCITLIFSLKFSFCNPKKCDFLFRSRAARFRTSHLHFIYYALSSESFVFPSAV